MEDVKDLKQSVDVSRTFDRRVIFLGAWISIFLLAVNATFSVLSNNLALERNWSLSDITWAYPLYLLVLSIVGIIAGRYSDKHDCTKLVFFGGIICGLGWILSGAVNSIPLFFLSFGIITPIGAGMMYNPLLTSTIKWFPDVSGKASGLLLSAASMGPFIMSPILTAGYTNIGVKQTLLYFGAVVIILPVLFSKTQIKAPENYLPKGWNPNTNDKKEAVKAVEVNNYTPKEMMRTSVFYKLLFIFMAVAAAGNMMIGVLYTIATVQMQFTPALAAIAVSVSTISNFVGRLSFGVIYDRLGGIKSLILSFVITIVSLILISFTTPSAVIIFFAGVALLGFAFGGPMVVFPPLTRRAFGPKYLGNNYGIIFFGYSLAAFVGPRIATYFYDLTGAFTYGYYVSAVLAAVGILFVFNINKSIEKLQEN